MISNGPGNGGGVQVVGVEEGGGYRVCGAALRGVVARTELRTLPVAVLSVAGATRGGKSFLLDFFLRYLTATPSARVDGSWLGADNEPLRGFSWRGGCDRDTVGIQLWSEPFVLTRRDGKKVVVLLMDTQGTFDNSSTMRDSTTIFAMSTLLSSVQIFNISMNIQEDHLQYLQLFTEYGKLAMAESGTPFQALQFLVRDWSYAYQHPYGADGGQQLLDRRLQINDSQPEELREVRGHIQSCFESVRCFLMPHPGLTVANSPNFIGCLADISKEFKDSLQELVHGLFEENLTLKKVNGQEIEIQELEEYFENYMEVFNSDQIPTPVTILNATSSACLEAALGAAREQYVSHMEGHLEPRSVPRAAVPRLHAAAKDAARHAFLARRTLAAPERAADRLDRLMQELDCLLANYAALNEEKMKIAIAASKEVYQKHMLGLDKCLMEAELEERHVEARRMAIDLFDTTRLPPEAEDGEDEDRRLLEDELNNDLELQSQITEINQANIDAAIAAAEERYKGCVCDSHEMSDLCLHNDHLTTLHRASKDGALALFDSRWTSPDSASNDHRTLLLSKINDNYQEISIKNTANNENAVNQAVRFYKYTMEREVLNQGCLHPLDFHSEHTALYDRTIAEFYRCRTYGNNRAGRDNYKLKLLQELPRCKTLFQERNEDMNKQAVKEAHASYERNMNVGRNANVPALLGPPDFNIFSRHEPMKQLAISKFLDDLRRPGPAHAIDIHLNELNRLINRSYGWLKLKLVGCGIMTIGSIVFLRRLW